MTGELHKTIGQILRETAKRFPDRQAVTDTGVRWSYRQLDLQSDCLMSVFLSHGIIHGVHVGIWAGDRACTLLCFYGIWKMGAVLSPLCTDYTTEEMTHCLAAADITCLIVDEAMRQKVGGLPKTVTILPMADLLDEAAVTPRQRKEPRVNCDDPDTILFTSGTTGRAKPVITTHFSRVNTLFAQAQALEATENDRFCSVLPMYHCFSLTATVLAAMAVGACVCFPPDRHGQSILQTIEAEGCTVLTAVPTLFSALLRRITEHEYDLSSLRTGLIGGSSYASAFFESICRQMNFCLLPSLGQTEATAGITVGNLSDTLEVRSHSIGRFLPHIEGCVKCPVRGKTLPAGTEGELCLRGFNVMQGYYNQPHSTDAVIDREGWLHTGDLGKIDAEGIVFYTGRLKELIIRGGENISPGEIESILSADRRVVAVKVIGVPDAHYTEELCACVVKNGTLTAKEVREAVATCAARFKVPRYVLFLPSLPLLPTGKVSVSQLRCIAKKRLDEDPASMLS